MVSLTRLSRKTSALIFLFLKEIYFFNLIVLIEIQISFEKKTFTKDSNKKSTKTKQAKNIYYHSTLLSTV